MNVPAAARLVVPQNVEELCSALAACDRAGDAVRIEGGGTLCGMGLPGHAGVVVSTRRLDGFVTHEHHDLTCAVLAGITLAAMDARLGQRGQFVPIDAPARSDATVGGTLAAGWAGPRRHLYGPARDYVIGMEVVLADGTLVRSGGMVVKNVTGYDMGKLYAGSFGTLGAIVRANFKTLPAPERTRALLAKFPEGTRARAIAQIVSLALTPALAFYAEGFRKALEGEDGAEGRLIVLFEGSASAIERATRDCRSALGKAGVPETTIVDDAAGGVRERVLDAAVANVGERSITYRALGRPDTVEARGLAMRELARRHELFADLLLDLMNGDAFLRVSDRDSHAFSARIEAFDDALHEIEPRAVVVAGASPMRPSLRVWGEPPAALAKMREIKQRFDPHGTLNAGRYVGGI